MATSGAAKGEGASGSKQVNVRLSAEQAARLQEKAERVNLQPASYVRRLVEEDLEELGGKSVVPAAPPGGRPSLPPTPKPDAPSRELSAVKEGLAQLRKEIERTDGRVQRLRDDVASAVRVILLALNPPGEGKLSQAAVDELIRKVFDCE